MPDSRHERTQHGGFHRLVDDRNVKRFRGDTDLMRAVGGYQYRCCPFAPSGAQLADKVEASLAVEMKVGKDQIRSRNGCEFAGTMDRLHPTAPAFQ